jgi:hypothetical protein
MPLNRLFLIVLIIFFSATSFAKDRLILMPVGGVKSESLKDSYRTALAESLGYRYEVATGMEVDKKIDEIWQAESKNPNCSEEACYKAMVMAFQAELLAQANVEKVGDGYLLTLRINNLIENTQMYAKSLPCRNCDEIDVQEKLKQLGTIRNGSSSLEFIGDVTEVDAGMVVVEELESGGRATKSHRAMLILESNPSGATVYLGGMKAGITPYQNMGLKSGQQIELRLSKQLYHDKNLLLILHGGSNTPATIQLTPAFGQLQIDSQPVGAKVLLSGEMVGTTPYTNQRIASGRYLVGLKKALYDTIENQVVTVKNGEMTWSMIL